MMSVMFFITETYTRISNWQVSLSLQGFNMGE